MASTTPDEALAIVARGPVSSGGWHLEHVVPRQLKDDEVLVRIVASGICLADVHFGDAPVDPDVDNPVVWYPRVLGHEGSGYVEQVGPAVTTARPGDPVILSYMSCGECYNCKDSHPAYCIHCWECNFSGEKGMYAGRDGRNFDIGGSFFGQSSFTSKAIVKQRSVANLAALNVTEAELKILAPLGCGVQTGSGSFINIADIQPDQEVAVVGVGGVGQSAIMAAAMVGCRTIIAIDRHASRLESARSLGATHVINTSDPGLDIVAEVLKVTGGNGVHVSLDTTGVQQLARDSWHFVRCHGKVMQVGLAQPQDTWNLSMADHMNSGKQLIGCVQGDSIPQDYIARMVGWYRSGQFPVERLVSFYAADDYKKALKDMREGTVTKPVLVWPNPSSNANAKLAPESEIAFSADIIPSQHPMPTSGMADEDVTSAEHSAQNDGSQLRPFQCRICGRSFLKSEHLVRHVRSHTKERPFKCVHCGSSYSRQDILVRHQRDVRCKRPEAGRAATGRGGAVRPVTSQEQSTSVNKHARPAPAPVASPPASDGTAHDGAALSRDATTNPLSPNMNAPPTQTHDRTSSWERPEATFELPQLPDMDLGMAGVAVPPSGLPNLSECFPTWNVNSDLHGDMLEMDFLPLEFTWTPDPMLPPVPTPSADVELMQVQHVQRIWFSHVPQLSVDELYPEVQFEPSSMPATEPASPLADTAEVDEQYRRKLQKSLRISSYEPTVPTADLLNVWIRLYFSKVHPVFPVIHAPTFCPSRANYSLLIAICAMGSLFTGSEQGLRQGIRLFERIHKATLLNWETRLARNQDAMISAIQSAVICQMFGMLSGSPSLLLTVDAFHGPPIAWARRVSLHNARPLVRIDPNTDGRRLEEQWREWARNEELFRIVHGLYIIDVELSSILHREPLQSFGSYRFSHTSSESAFMASNARDWKARVLENMQQGQDDPSSPDSPVVPASGLSPNSVPVFSSFTAYAILEGLSMQARSCWTSIGLDETCRQKLHQPLADFHQRFLSGDPHGRHDPLHLSILWHTTHMITLADFDLLEKAVGREGRKLFPSEEVAVTAWAKSSNAVKCILHAGQVQRDVQSMTIMSEVAMHVPRAIFWASLAVVCRIRFGSSEDLGNSHGLTGHLGGRDMVTGRNCRGSAPHLDAQSTGMDYSALKTMLLSMTDLLRHIGHWEIARRLGTIVSASSNFAFDFG